MHRFLVAVAQRNKRMQHIGRDWRGAVNADRGRYLDAELVFELQKQSLRRLLADAGNLGEAPRFLHRHCLRELRDRQTREHRQRSPGADAADLDELPERAPLGFGAETEEQVRVLAHNEMGEQRNALAEIRQIVESAHRHIDFVRDVLHIEQDLRRVLLYERSGQAADHERGAGSDARIIAWPLGTSEQVPREPRFWRHGLRCEASFVK